MLSRLSRIGRSALNLLSNNQRKETLNWFHNSSIVLKKEDIRSLASQMPVKDQGTEGESTIMMDSLIQTRSDMFPTEHLPDQLFNGIPFAKVPVCNIKTSKNNTIITVADAVSGEIKMLRSCGIEGFKNTRKGTNVAAQATAISFGTAIQKKGFKTVRVRVRGLGPGRISAIKGLQMSGLDIISITDNTPVSSNPPRPRKQRRL